MSPRPVISSARLFEALMMCALLLCCVGSMLIGSPRVDERLARLEETCRQLRQDVRDCKIRQEGERAP